MLPRRFSLLAPVLMLALGLVSSDALAHRPTRHGPDHMTRRSAVHARTVARHHHHLVRHDLTRPAGPYPAPRIEQPGYGGPGYIFVPGKGILGEACNMPTSTCPNELRDIR